MKPGCFNQKHDNGYTPLMFAAIKGLLRAMVLSLHGNWTVEGLMRELDSRGAHEGT